MYCSECCSPCCGYCIYAEKEYEVKNGEHIRVVVSACNKHPDSPNHQAMAKILGYCKDFVCTHQEEKGNGS